MLAMVDSIEPTQRQRSQKKKEERVEARVTDDVKRILEHAASLQGRSLTDFVVSSAYDAATRAIAVHHHLNEVVLTARGTKDFVEAVLNPSEPSERLMKAARRYKDRTRK